MFHDNYQVIYQLAKDCLEKLKIALPELKSTSPKMTKFWADIFENDGNSFKIPWEEKPKKAILDCPELGCNIEVFRLLECCTAVSNCCYVSMYLHPCKKLICIMDDDEDHLQVDITKEGWEKKIEKHLIKLNDKLLLFDSRF